MNIVIGCTTKRSALCRNGVKRGAMTIISLTLEILSEANSDDGKNVTKTYRHGDANEANGRDERWSVKITASVLFALSDLI